MWFARSSSLCHEEFGGGRKRLLEFINAFATADPLSEMLSTSQCLGPIPVSTPTESLSRTPVQPLTLLSFSMVGSARYSMTITVESDCLATSGQLSQVTRAT